MTSRLRAAVGSALLAALAAHAAIYAVIGDSTAALDTGGWLLLLVLFAFETRRPGHGVPRLLRATRLVATVMVIGAAVAYWRDADWLDAINSLLWFAVVVVWELQLRGARRKHRIGLRHATRALHGALAVMPLAWLAQGAWFDAWDATLWLAAYAVIEHDVAHHAS